MLAGLCLQPGGWDATTGSVDHVDVSDISMHDVSTPLFFVVKPGNTASGITINRLAATGVYRAASSIEGWASAPIRNVTLTDVSIRFRGVGSTRPNNGATKVNGPGVDARPLPCWGLYARNVEELRLENVRLSLEGDDARPAMIFDKAAGLALDAVHRPDRSGSILMTGVTGLVTRDVVPPLPP
jgi:hypothetical protein